MVLPAPPAVAVLVATDSVDTLTLALTLAVEVAVDGGRVLTAGTADQISGTHQEGVRGPHLRS